MTYLLQSAYLSVSILNADIHSNHEENSNGYTKISNQTTDLHGQQRIQCDQNLSYLHEWSSDLQHHLWLYKVNLTGPGR